mgnify:CR=1 FL=1
MVEIRGYQAGQLQCAMVGDDGRCEPWGTEPGDLYLPHSCDEWIIGNRACAEALLADLTRLLASDVP